MGVCDVVIINRFFKRYLLVSGISLMIYLLYVYQIQPGNAYMKMEPLDAGFPEVCLWLIWNCTTALLMPSRLEKPSDCFLMTYSLFVVLCGASMWGASGILDISGGIALLVFLSISLFLYRVLVFVLDDALVRNVRMIYFLRTSSYALPLFALLLVGVGVGALSGQSGGFDLAGSYVRRIAGRAHFPTGMLTTYLFVMALNGVAPFMAFLATFRRKPILLIMPILFSVYAFWLIGTKAPVLMVGLLAFVGMIFRRSDGTRIPMRVALLVFFLLAVALAEYLATGYSYISDYFIRRAFAVVGQLQAVYSSYMLQYFRGDEWLWGSSSASGQSASLFLGNWYYGNENTNANTNTLLYSMLQQGLAGWFVAICFISVVFSLMNYLYTQRRTREVMGLAFLYALLLAEQAYSTAFLSSGIGLLLILMTLFKLDFRPSGETRETKGPELIDPDGSPAASLKTAIKG